MTPSSRLKSAINRLTPKQRQYAMLGAIMTVGVGTLWAVLAFTESRPKTPNQQSGVSAQGASVTNIGVMPGGQQVSPIDQWVGNAGKKLAQYEADKQDQARINTDRKAFEDTILKRFAEFEQKQTSASQGKVSITPPAQNLPPAPSQYPPQSAISSQQNLPPPPPPSRNGQLSGMPPGSPSAYSAAAEFSVAPLVRISLSRDSKGMQSSAGTPSGKQADAQNSTVDTYLPVSFTRGILLGGLDAPTGGQSQSNPHPVLIRLADSAVLPNRYRSNVKECFVIAAGYGDISSERAYLRTENLSCVRHDGSTLEVKIQGSLYGEDGKVGIRGRLVTKQGQMLANALLAGVVGGIGQGFSQSGSSVTTSTFGTIATTSGSGSEQMEHGIGGGVGHALDRLAQYYIKLAEQTFPVIEIDAGRQVDVVITKGVRIDSNEAIKARSTADLARDTGNSDRYSRISDDDAY